MAFWCHAAAGRCPQGCHPVHLQRGGRSSTTLECTQFARSPVAKCKLFSLHRDSDRMALWHCLRLLHDPHLQDLGAWLSLRCGAPSPLVSLVALLATSLPAPSSAAMLKALPESVWNQAANRLYTWGLGAIRDPIYCSDSSSARAATCCIRASLRGRSRGSSHKGGRALVAVVLPPHPPAPAHNPWGAAAHGAAAAFTPRNPACASHTAFSVK